MTYDVLFQWATLVVLMILVWRSPELFVAGLFLDGLSAEPEAPDAVEGTEGTEAAEIAEVTEVAEAFQVVGMGDMADTAGLPGEIVSAIAESGGWDFFELFEGFEWE